QREFARFEARVHAVHADLACRLVDLEPAEVQDGRTAVERFSASAQNGFKTRYDFARGERFANIIVGAQFESDDAVDFIGARRQHNDGNVALLAPQGARDLESVDGRQTHVEYHRVGHLACGTQRRVAVRRGDDVELF